MRHTSPSHRTYRFFARFLCVVLLLSGSPIAVMADSVTLTPRQSTFDQIDAAWDAAETATHQPWLAALGVLLASAATEAGEDRPPSPPGFSETPHPYRDATLEYLKAVEKAALEEIPMVPGWNLVSLPEEPANTDPATVLASIGGAYNSVWTYDACDANPWKVYDPNDVAGSTLSAIDHHQGLWIDSTSPANLSSEGTLPDTTTFQLCTGWNLIGYPAGQARHVRNALQSIEGKYQRVFGYDPTDTVDPWEVYSVGAPIWANDLSFMVPGRGYWVLVTEAVTLEIANQDGPPEVQIHSPDEADAITTFTPVLGTITSKILDFWTINYRQVSEGPWQELKRGFTPATHEELLRIDPTLLKNGLYEVRLEAYDFEGRGASTSVQIFLDGRQKIGHLRLDFLDLELQFAHLPLQIVRTYDSRDRLNVGDFGHGWRLSVNDVRIWENIEAGESWQGTTSGGQFPSYSVTSSLPHIVAIALPGGKLLRFRVLIEPETTPLAPPEIVTLSFIPLPGTFATLEPVGLNSELRVVGSFPGPVQLFDQDLDIPFNPERYRLTLRDGTKMIISDLTGLVEISEPNGSRLTFNTNSIEHSNGPSINFVRDGQGRITEIQGSRGEVLTYAYDSTGDLRSFTDEQGTVQFSYIEEHFLYQITDPQGIKTLAYGYDDDGRLIGVCDRVNRCNQATHDLEGQKEIIVDAEGVKTILEYDDRGNIIAIEDGLQNRTVLEYDELDRLEREIDPLGGTTELTWEESSLTKLVLPHAPEQNDSDFTFEFDHDGFGNRKTATYPSGGELHWNYDAKGNLLEMRDEADNVLVQYARDISGRVIAETDPISTAHYDNFHPLDIPRRIETDGEIWTMEYDDAGRLTFFDNGRTSTSHDLSEPGRVLRQQTGEPDMEFRAFFDGSLQSWKVDDSTSLEFQRDGFSRLDTVTTSSTLNFDRDAAGRITDLRYDFGDDVHFDYDVAGRRIRETTQNGQVTETVYDPAGRILEIHDSVPGESSNVSISKMSYWPSGEIKTITDARQNTWDITHTPVTRQVTDPLNRVNTTHYSPHGLVTKEIFPDLTETQWTYALSHPLVDADQYVTSRTDEAQRVQHFDYDSAMRLTSATDFAGETFQFIHDGFRLEKIISPEQRQIEQAYDDHDRIRFITREDGGVEELLYNGLEVDETARILPSGERIDLVFDDNGDLLSRSFSGSTESFTWMLPGLIKTATSSEGTTVYDYDLSNGALRHTETPDSGSLEIQRDGRGRVSAVMASTADGSQTFVTHYHYDILGNVEKVVDPMGGETMFEYDVVNRLEYRTLPNGVRTHYEYDLRNRVKKITHQDAQSVTLASVEYIRAPSGEPTKIVREDGSFVEIEYDPALRVSEERFFSASSLLTETVVYSYDKDGNRQTVQRNSGTEIFGYGPGHRLTSVAGASNRQYTLDQDGRVTALTADGTTQTLTYDALDRLKAVEENGQPLVAYRHDAQGRRLAIEESGAETRLLNVPTPSGQGLTQPHLATAESGQVLAGFVFAGSSPLMRFGPDGPVYYLEDGLGSIISLTDATATSVASFQYDAFGSIRQSIGDPSLPTAVGGDFRFQGQWLDEATGLYHLRARQYSPQIGRFLTRDPVPFQIDQPELSHPYVFAANNPFLYNDPSGLFLGGINEQSIMNAIQSNLSQVKAAFVRDLLRDIRNEGIKLAVNTVGEILAQELHLAEVVDKNYKKLGFNTRGDLFEFYGLRSMCEVLPDAWKSLLWFEPWVDTRGNPKTDGFQCPPDGKSGAKGRKKAWGPVGRPDLLLPLSSRRPTQLPPMPLQTVVIGDLKITLKYAYTTWRYSQTTGKRKQENQFLGIRHHAARYGFRIAAVFALSKGSKSKRSDYCQMLQNLFLQGKPKVILIAVTLTGGVCPATNVKLR